MNVRILIAEDEDFIGKLYKFELEQHEGVTVDQAKNGEETIEAIETNQYQLLLLDLLMPDLDGFSVLAELKKRNIRIPFTVVLTNLSQDIDRKKCHDLGAVDYIVKSDTSAAELWERIKKYIK